MKMVMKLAVVAAAILLAVPFTAVASMRFAPKALPPSEYADTEVSSHYAIDTGTAGENKFALSIELAPATGNNVEVAFGIDANENGELEIEETDFIVGWDCGAWFYRDLRAGKAARAAFDVSGEGRRRLDWILYLNTETREARGLEASDGDASIPFAVLPTFFNPSWNTVRITVRGRDTAAERIIAEAMRAGFAVKVR